MYFCHLIFKVKVSFLQLAPFLKSVTIYAVIGYCEFFNSNLLSTILKCLPIFCLIAFVFFMGFKFTDEFQYHKRILLGLAFSSIGDAFLDYGKGELFPFGMLAFAVAQMFYISAFGFKPLRIVIGLISYGIGVFGKIWNFRFFSTNFINLKTFPAIFLMFENFDEVLVFGVPFYSALLLTMMWRALSRCSLNNLPKVICAVGAVFFVASDGVIAFSMFYSPIQHSRVIIMATYYIAQLCITLSILDHQVIKPKSSVKSK